MNLFQRVLLFALLACTSLAWSQNVKIIIPAGTPEDKDLSAIASEQDAQKRIALYQDFLKKYADSKPAFAYASWQLSQQYLAAGDAANALEYGDKALALYPNNLDILVSQTGVAQAMKDNSKVVDYAVRGAEVVHSIASQPKPADMVAEDWASHLAEEEASAKYSYEVLETSAYNAIVAEQDAGQRMSDIEKFTPAFPKSKFEEPISQLALYSLQQLNQPQRLVAYGEKVLAADPDSIPILLMLANAYSEDPKQGTKAIGYANKVLSLTGKEVASADKKQKLSAGVAHSTIGYAYLKQSKFTAAVAELKTAVSLLQEDPQAMQAAYFRLGYAYAKQNRKSDSMAALKKATEIDGPYRGPAREMLSKVSAAGKE